MNWSVSPEAVFQASPIMPVMVIKNAEDAVPMARALAEGGIATYEVTLRTPAALDAIAAIRKEMPDALVGAGTVLTESQYDQAVAAGARFVISPGYTRELLVHAVNNETPLIPGVSTPSEIMTARALGYHYLKFFPAEVNGGAEALKAISAPLSDMYFCPTGGVNPVNVESYLRLPCVKAIGGTWMLPADAIARKDWRYITELTVSAVELVNNLSR